MTAAPAAEFGHARVSLVVFTLRPRQRMLKEGTDQASRRRIRSDSEALRGEKKVFNWKNGGMDLCFIKSH